MKLSNGPSLANQGHKLYHPEEAEQVAKLMNEVDDWDYRVVHDPKGTGYSFIEIYDEDGQFVTRMV